MFNVQCSTGYLQLYLDTDYLLPVAVGADGNVVKYQDQTGDSRLWLYFAKNGTGADFVHGEPQKAAYEARMEGAYGDFWSKIETEEHVGTEPFTYIELLEVGGILDTLREWCKPMLGTPMPALVLNFATTTGLKARRVFIDYMERKGFTVRSYSVEVNDLVAGKVMWDRRSIMTPAFGDQLLILQSMGGSILLSAMTWCGDVFMQGDKPMVLSKQGDDFKRRALATMVVARMEQQNNMLSEREKEQEIAFQTQFADEWLKGRDGKNIRVRGFFYSKNPAQVYPSILVSADQLDLLVADDSRVTTGKIAEYYRTNIVGRHLHTILIGDAFRDELFLSHCIDVTESKGKYTFFSDNALQEALGRYYYQYGDMAEPTGELERRYLTMEGERERIRKYVHNAETLGMLRTAIEDSRREVTEAVSNLQSRRGEIEESWTAYMRQSKFDEAERVLEGIETDSALTATLAHLHDTLTRVTVNMSLLTDLKQMNEVHVRDIVGGIEQGFDELQQLQAAAKALEEHPRELHQRTSHYRDVYGTYLDFKRRLDSEQSLDGKRDVLNELKARDLSMEPLPKIEVRQVTARLVCTVETVKGGFLGLKKEKRLHVLLQVMQDDTLPIPCVLMISDSKKVRVDRRAWCADIAEGENCFERTLSQSELPRPTDGSLVVQLLPNEENTHLSSRIYCESQRISI